MKIPSDARKVFDWVIFDIYHRDQKMYDWSIGTFERVKRVPSIQIIPVVWDKIVISKQHQPHLKDPYMSLVWWRSDEGELPLDAAKRELLEETWLQSNDIMLYKVYNPYDKIDREVYFYIARNCEKVAEQALDNWEKIELMYVNFEEFISFVGSSNFWFSSFTVDILTIQKEKKLEEFKNIIFW